MSDVSKRKPVFSKPLLFGAASALPVLLAFAAGAVPTTTRLQYNRDVRPILAENCFACHGPDSASRQADLRLDRQGDATMMRNGHAPIVKGKPQASELIRRVTGQGPLMPPPNGHKKLTAQQIATLKQWITEGAEYEKNWSYIPPRRGALPPVSAKNAKWVRNPIDRFILARLEKTGLQPAPEADRRTLARRLSLDLTGLPPEPADVEAFVHDKSPNYYEKLVDKYMATPQWGEHRGRYWLDAARYADTHGIHFDNYREMWTYRDWVIKAFNKNMPFDEFTIEQLAGDLLPNHTLDQTIATGFNRCNITSNEGGAIDEEYKVLYARDRTETTSQVFLGSTLGCAVCHDHKFDPFTQKEFYSLSAFFNNTTQAAMDGNIKDTPPVVPVPLDADRTRFEALRGELADARKQAEERKLASRPDFDRWLGGADSRAITAKIPTSDLRLLMPLDEGQGKEVKVTLDGKTAPVTAAAEPGWDAGQVSARAFQRKAGSVVEVPAAGDFEKDQSYTYAAWIRLSRGDQGGAVIARMDDQHDFRGWDMWLEGGRVGTHIISKWPEDALKVVARDPIPAGQWHHVCVTYSGGGKPSSVRIYIDGTERALDVAQDTLKSTIRTTVPFKIGQRHTTSAVDGTGIQDVRLYSRALSPEDAANLARGTRAAWLIEKAAPKTSQATGSLSVPEKDELFGWWLTGSDENYRTLSGKVTSLEGEDRAIRMRGTVAHVMNEKSEEAMAYILARGEYDKRKDKVTPITPAILPAMPPDLPRNRLGLAKWLVRPENPLTSRVTVNRFWQELFGVGLVRTSGDFGVTGELPSHPELLDWLAIEFHQNGWNVKKLFKLMVTSATYRQAFVNSADKKLKDPANRLLSRGPRFRMDAEMVRDYALATSGLLVKKIGGPSVKPYQPDGVWEAVAMPGSNTRDYKHDMGEGLYRRSMYTFWKRAAPPASLDIFNAPNRETCTVRRERTDTPLQALVTLNDIQYVEAARTLAQNALKSGGATPDAQIDYIARRVLARPFRAEELPIVRKALTNLSSFYAAHGKEAKELVTTGDSKPDTTLQPERLAAWTMLCNQILNLDEVLNK